MSIYGWIFLVIFVILFLIWLGSILFKKRNRYQARFPHSYVCVDGHHVRSLAECLIDNTLYRWGVDHSYEDYIQKSEGNFKYDFYLTDFDCFIEFFGYSGKKYYKTREIKEKIYRKYHLNLIILEPLDLAKLEEQLYEKMKPYLNQKKKSISPQRFCPHCGEELDIRFELQ